MTDSFTVVTKPVLSGHRIFGVVAAITTSFNFRTMSANSCQGGTVFKCSTVKMVFKFEVCFNFVVNFELGGFVSDTERFCDKL